jgi:hypothetical protein
MSKSKIVPTNLKLYNQVKQETKKRFKVWPSAYASGFLVQEYKRRGGTYQNVHVLTSKDHFKSTKSTIPPLKRWYEEQWIDVCHLPRHVACGRNKSSGRAYPYCRPLNRIDKHTPKTASSISHQQRLKLCSSKRKNPTRKVFIKKS